LNRFETKGGILNNTVENTITWEMIDDKPVAHVASADMTFEELRLYGRQVYSVLAAMAWHQAVLLEVGSTVRGYRGVHLVRKAEYEQDHNARSLCGKKSGPWDIVEVLRDDQRGICKKCLAMQEFAVSLYEESEEGEHGSK